jgi:hypothetical protein
MIKGFTFYDPLQINAFNLRGQLTVYAAHYFNFVQYHLYVPVFEQ